jgi:cob(I)alamin adenosyltransferase
MARRLKNGLVHIYTGSGKGKTTAAFGLALRAAGAGLKVCIYQFIKGMPYSENALFKKIKNVRIEQCGRGCFIKGLPSPKDIEYARNGLAKARKDIGSGKYDMVILDEANIALKLGLIKTEDMIEIIKRKPRGVELVLTGRYCPRTLLKYADLVTEMKKIKHPFDKGVLARKGIEY